MEICLGIEPFGKVVGIVKVPVFPELMQPASASVSFAAVARTRACHEEPLGLMD
jgi:hypothetical protein